MYPARTPATTTASAKAIWILFFASSLIMQVPYPVNLGARPERSRRTLGV